MPQPPPESFSITYSALIPPLWSLLCQFFTHKQKMLLQVPRNFVFVGSK
ncbi:hypothetical protein SLEP1_g60372 [Rubroshorea leprosula]|uniref:Uncharacterized protein n=1 Tax=Rubroshorea leprosula TaxID=152421 RepID=A0AAV5MWC3_9ROSI|nr:hypothetical protein SLEP1_g60372 [Rubroshorea leprosula]